MVDRIDELRPKPADSEKITINLGHVDLGQIDLLVQEGFYSNRTDFIRTAIRNQLERHADVIKQAVARKKVELGLRHFSREDLEAVRDAGQMLHIRVLGLARIANDVTPELARATVGSIAVLGAATGQFGGQGRSGRPPSLIDRSRVIGATLGPARHRYSFSRRRTDAPALTVSDKGNLYDERQTGPRHAGSKPPDPRGPPH